MYAAAIAASIETFAAEVGFEPFALKNKNAKGLQAAGSTTERLTGPILSVGNCAFG